MKKLLSILTLTGLAATTLAAQSNRVSNITGQLWNDDSFVKEFLGSYGFLAGYEPQISEEEKEALRSLIDLIKASPKAAIQQLEPQITKDSSAAFDFILANLYFQDGNLAKAEQYYSNAIVKHPDFRRAYKNLGLVQVQNGDFKKSIKTISKAMELGEVDGRSYGLLGYGYLTEERYYPAEAAYRQAILMQPDNKDWKVGLAQCLLQTERYADAIALFDTLIKDDPDNSDYWLLQSNAYIGKNEPLAAAKNIEIVRRMGQADLSTLTLLGDIYMNNEVPDLALDAYLSAVELATPEDAKSLIRAAEVLTRTLNYEQASTMIAKSRSTLGENLSDENDLKLLTLEAKIARSKGEDDKAAELLAQIIERDVLNGDAIIELANYYADQSMELAAEAEDSNDKEKTEELEEASKLALAKAITRYQQAEGIDAFEFEALKAHAQTLVRNREYSKAVPLLRRALQIEDDRNLADYADRVERAARAQG